MNSPQTFRAKSSVTPVTLEIFTMCFNVLCHLVVFKGCEMTMWTCEGVSIFSMHLSDMSFQCSVT
eukprot:02574.XXX_3019_3213_1 [CDS] Oithona nana genome sequencing.